MAIGPILTTVGMDGHKSRRTINEKAKSWQQQHAAARTIYNISTRIYIYSIILYIIVQLHNNTGKTKRDKYNYIHVYIYLHIHIYNC